MKTTIKVTATTKLTAEECLERLRNAPAEEAGFRLLEASHSGLEPREGTLWFRLFCQSRKLNEQFAGGDA